MIWKEFKEAAPELAQLGEERFQRTGLVLVGTLRKDGSPRISPVEPYLVQGHLLLGMMLSKKALDLLRDPRLVLHNTVSDPNGSEGVFTLRGLAMEVRNENMREHYCQAYSERWKRPPPEPFPSHIFSVAIEIAAFVGWDTEKGEMTVKRWSPDRGLTEATRKYP